MSTPKKQKKTTQEFVGESTYGYLPHDLIIQAIGASDEYEDLLHGSLIYEDDAEIDKMLCRGRN